ncbi:MAG: class I tRNA ligase family protein [Patescibacteria group bacterium]
MISYDHKKIEKKWQSIWEKTKAFKARFPSRKKKFYSLIEFPYPSGDGLHVGHIRSNTAMDIISRKRRAEGYNVLYPMGWDAFGLPTENYAIKTGIHPALVTKQNTDIFRKQLKNLGFSFDWDREINTTDPKYYKWTQWIFLQLFKKGLAYKATVPINWCLNCKIGLANEEVVDGKCERCNGPTEKRDKEQWMLAITKYAERLDKDLDSVDYLPRIKTQQRNWIGRSVGAEIDFKIKGTDQSLKVFTTRADTLYGATYLVIAPEHKILNTFKSRIDNALEVGMYVQLALNQNEIERVAENKEKTGVPLKGLKAINPLNGEELPIYVADYVLSTYGTGVIMGVPAHDERDYEFAQKLNLPIREVVIPNRIDKNNPPRKGKKIVERKNVHAIVRNPKNGKVLCLKWKKQPWITFPMGGVEDGEDLVEAARREAREETGYTNLKLVKVMGGQARAEYFAAHKNENRISYTNAVMFDLTDEFQEGRSQKEKDSYDIVWLPKNEIAYPKIVHAELDIWLSRWDKENVSFVGDGVLINSGKFDGLDSEKARREITEFVKGKRVIKFKLRDWVFSRQRYWGEPIPIINCKKCGLLPVPLKQLPVLLPDVKNYKPTDNGESPLSNISSWVNVNCPKCKGKAKRETDVMPNWAGSSWYFLRYTDPANNKEFAGKTALKYFTPVDWYNGGMEHTTLHLLYSRFWHKFLYDLKLVPASEPYKKRTSHGLILAEGGVKMSKSKGNVINPDTIVENVGADTLRLYEMFMGPFDQAIAWNEDSMIGCRRFLERVIKLQDQVTSNKSQVTSKELGILINQTIKKVTDDIESMRFNTAVSALMILSNEFEKREYISKNEFETFLKLLSPFTPHISEELWQKIGNKRSVHLAKWPIFDKKKLLNEKVNVSVSIDGKSRGIVSVKDNATEKEVIDLARRNPEIGKWIKEHKKVIYVKGKIINFVTGK